MKGLYSVTLSPDQVLAACEQYVMRQTKDEKLGATASWPHPQSVNVEVYVKRVRKAKAAA